MIAVAALLTITALAIWAVRVVRRPVDWRGPFTVGPPPEPTPIQQINTACQDILDAVIPAYAAAFRQAADVIVAAYRPDTPAITRALRASERDDHRREGQ